ncbi:MAG: SulP family inorganic anion transporter [Acidimicrobiia bacterium]
MPDRLPGLTLLRAYRRSWLGRDVVAGLVLTALLVPQGMAYAELAGLPPVTGLYTTVLALAAYALFGPSRILVLGPDSALGPLIAAALLPLVGANGDPAQAVALAGMLAILIGVLCIAGGLARLGMLAELLSRPVRVGFLNGIALIVIVAQLPTLFGFDTDANGLVAETRAFVAGVRDGETVAASLAIGLGSLFVILICRAVVPSVPGVLIALVGSSVLVATLGLDARGVSVVGAIPSGFPAPTWPQVGIHDVGALLVAAAGLALVVLADTTAMSRSLAARHGERVDANRELTALGVANAAAGLFQGFPVSASASRSMVAESVGSRTQLTGVVAASATVAVLVFAGGLGRDLPTSALAAIVIAAGLILFDGGTLRWLWTVRRSELFLSVVATAGVAILGPLQGIGVAIALSLADFVRRAWRPYDATLGRIPERKGYHDVERHPEASMIPGLVLYRFDAPLFFANAQVFADRLLAAVRARGEGVRWVIVAAEPITDVDSTAVGVLEDLLDDLEADGVEIAFAELKGPVKDRFRRYGLLDRISGDRFYPTLGTAIDGYLGATGTPWVDWSDQRPDDGNAEAPR